MEAIDFKILGSSYIIRISDPSASVVNRDMPSSFYSDSTMPFARDQQRPGGMPG